MYLLALINSTLISWFHRLSSPKGTRKAFPKVLIGDIRNFPIPAISLSELVDKAKHDHIVKFVEQMLKAKEELAAAKLDSDVQRLELRCATLDRQIDEAVYELYGLTEEEIKIVEGK